MAYEVNIYSTLLEDWIWLASYAGTHEQDIISKLRLWNSVNHCKYRLFKEFISVSGLRYTYVIYQTEEVQTKVNWKKNGF